MLIDLYNFNNNSNKILIFFHGWTLNNNCFNIKNYFENNNISQLITISDYSESDFCNNFKQLTNLFNEIYDKQLYIVTYSFSNVILNLYLQQNIIKNNIKIISLFGSPLAYDDNYSIFIKNGIYITRNWNNKLQEKFFNDITNDKNHINKLLDMHSNNIFKHKIELKCFFNFNKNLTIDNISKQYLNNLQAVYIALNDKIFPYKNLVNFSSKFNIKHIIFKDNHLPKNIKNVVDNIIKEFNLV